MTTINGCQSQAMPVTFGVPGKLMESMMASTITTHVTGQGPSPVGV